ncbi:MAG: hypothetical protein ACPG4T_02645, partial [Nannocystaceae bacterium]
MLYAAETYFLTLLQQALGDSTPISRANDLKESSLRLVVEAVELVIAPEPERRLESERVTPHYVHIFQTQVIADATSFELPDDVTGEVLCVESPPGQTLRPEDDYRVQQRRILLRRTPKQEARNDEARNYVVRLRGAPAQGLVRRDPCTLKLHIHAEAKKREGLVPL